MSTTRSKIPWAGTVPLAVAAVAVTSALLSACSSTGVPRPRSGGSADVGEPAAAVRELNVVATTTLVGDIVSRVGGDAISLTVLLPPGADPHGFEPTPRDVVAVADADVVFANGLGLEEFLRPLLDSAGGAEKVTSVSEGIQTLDMGEAARDGSGGEAASDHDDADHDLGADPHVWFDPDNVAIWATNIERALSELDPDSEKTYRSNSADLAADLTELGTWIETQVDEVPPNRRKLVSDHDTFGYFSERFGFEQLGTLHGFSTMSEQSAADLARLEDTIRSYDVPAIFVGNTVNPDLANRVASDTETEVVTLYTGSLSEAGGPADTYDSFMRYNVRAIVDALASRPTATVRP